MLKACSRCGRIHSYTYDCRANQSRKFTTTDESKLRSKNSWKKKRETIREKAFNLCEVCKDQGVYNYNSLEIHHVIKLKEDPNKLLDDNNLICLCTYHHKQADRGELTKDYLLGLIEKRERDNQ